MERGKREIVLENPFHPLDLSAHDLLAVYKRFQESRQANRNPKQELPVETVAQMIASLRGCPPSYVQKCISQALIKDTISWNEFLTFLDQESEIREQILDWLMHEKATLKYKQEREWPFRAKIARFYEEITFLRFLELADSERLILCAVDKVLFFLFSESNGKLFLVDSYANKSERAPDKTKPPEEEIERSAPSKILMCNDSKLRKGLAGPLRSVHKTEKSEREKALLYLASSSSKAQEPQTQEEEDAFFKRERKNISSLFSIFRDLSLEHSITYSKIAAQKLSEKGLSAVVVAQLRDAYSGLLEERNPVERRPNPAATAAKPLDKAKGLLKELHRQKRALSYNPYAAVRNQQIGEFEVGRKKLGKERKGREYSHEANQENYCEELRCLAVVFFNLEVALVKVVREYNKVGLEEQDKLRLQAENEHKKNEVIEAVAFYKHSIVGHWFLLVLFRVQYKNQFRNENESYVRGYEIELVENKRRGDSDLRFRHRRQTFTLAVANQQGDAVSRFEVFNMQPQPQFGLHFISVNGRYVCFREDFIERTEGEHVYFVFGHEERFRNAGLSLSCLAVGEGNQVVFGTIRGILIVYDVFSRQFRLRKVGSAAIVQLRVAGSLAYLLTAEEKLVVYDLVKSEEVQHLSVRNDSKLHEKVKRFELHRHLLFVYGTEVRSYCQFVDERLQHQQRKMQTIYRWRLDKLLREEATFAKQGKLQGRDLARLLPKRSPSAAIELVISSENYFLLLTEILELVVVEKASLKIKFTMVLGIPHDSKVMRMALSGSQKLLALLLFNQTIYIFNIHTQDQYQLIRPSPYLKHTSLAFLDAHNEYLLATGTESGKLLLSPYNTLPEKTPKVLELHRRAVTVLLIVRGEYLVSCGEDCLVAVWLLPFNILKHELRLAPEVGCVIEEVGCCRELAYLRSAEGLILEVNAHEGKLLRAIRDYTSWNACAIDPIAGRLLGLNRELTLQIAEKGREGWKTTNEYALEGLKGEVRAMGVVGSEKAVIFMENGSAVPWSYQTGKLGRPINLGQQ